MSVDNNYLKIFVGNVPFQCTKEEFIECFKKYDGFIDGDMVNRNNSENSRGFGFITFKTHDHADGFLSIKNPVMLKNRILRFTKYDNSNKKLFRHKPCEKNYIFIKNVPKNIKPLEIRNIFSNYGDIGSCFVNTNIITGESKGTAVVEMKDDDIFNKLLIFGEIILDDQTKLDLTKWKQKVKVKKTNSNESKDIYRAAFNAGRNIGILEGMKIAKFDKNDLTMQ